MKKLALLSTIVLSTIALSFGAVTTPDPVSSGNHCGGSVTVSGKGPYLQIWDLNGNYIGGAGYFNQIDPYCLPFDYWADGLHRYIYDDPICVGQDYATCLANNPTGDFGSYYVGTPPPPPITDHVGAMVANATSSFTNAVGFTPAQTVTSVGGMFVLPIIGGGIMLLFTLLKWIIGLAILMVFVRFAFRAFRIYGERKRGKSHHVKHK